MNNFIYWTYTVAAQTDLLPDRGFTGHEYLPWFKLYNMNGRLYDPVVGRFLEPDPVVQNYYSTQNLNKYSYCLNNPLKYADPSGYKMAFNLGHGDGTGEGDRWIDQNYLDHMRLFPGGGNFPRGYGMYQTNINSTIKSLMDSSFGGSWSEHSGLTFYSNDYDAFMMGCALIEAYNYWNGTTPKSLGGAILLYNLLENNQLFSMNDNQVGVEKNSNVGTDFYYNALDGIIFPNGTKMSRNDFLITLESDPTANARYLGFLGGKHNINFSMSDYEVTVANIKALAIHEAYGHGVMGYGNDTKDHYKAYFASIKSIYWNDTTERFKQHTVEKMWYYYHYEVGYKSMPEPYQSIYFKYIKR